MRNSKIEIKNNSTDSLEKKSTNHINRPHSNKFAIVTSIIALLVSLVALYLNFFCPAEPRIAVGDRVNIHHYKEGNLGISIPVSISNSGAKFVTIERLALLIRKTDSKEGYLLEPHTFGRLENNDLVGESLSSPIPLSGRSNLVKEVLFRTSTDKSNGFDIDKPGTYELTLLAWVGDSVKPRAIDSFSLVLEEGDIKILSDYQLQQRTTTLQLPLSKWRQWGAHNLTEVEVNILQQK